MLAEADDVPHYERRLDFEESLHSAMVAGEDPPVFQELTNNEEEEERTKEETQAGTPASPLNRNHKLSLMML